ncbi:hypothetical protein [Stagnihabitans tardus]|uniref:Calcium-binding protein n=1 Tax=Stagnihabitans tardus TaxID=2699202 RepID=A0AAE4Y5K6_9RHOB|nr:hypothetical protein [Stagnihabitans tardus]NBZ86143.1 hypothetical protein [Stagnihabitans tardus]
MAGQQSYDQLNQETQDWTQDLIDQAVEKSLEDLQDKLTQKAGALQAMSTDPDLAGLPNVGTVVKDIGEFKSQVDNLTTVVTAVTSAVTAARSLNTLSCGEYETGPNKAYGSSVQLFENSSNAALNLLRAASAGLTAAALIPGAQALAIPGAGLGLTVQALEAIQAKVAAILSAISEIGTISGEMSGIVGDYMSVDPVGDARRLKAEYKGLPVQNNTGGGSSTPPPAQPTSGTGNPFSAIWDPLVLDLDRDGVEMTARGAPPVFWDGDGSGVSRMTTWVDPDDGLLVRDLDFDGLVDGQAELFGSESVNALDDLAQADSNGDGVIDARDAIWGSLRVWRDLDQDGQTDAGELETLTEAGIVSLDIANQGGQGSALADAVAQGFGRFTTVDGLTHEMAAVGLAQDGFVTNPSVPAGVTITAAILALPQLHGMGQAPDLRLAMALDPALQASVQALRDTGASLSGPEFHAAFEAMVQDWVGVEEAGFASKEAFAAAFLAQILQTRPGLGSGLLAAQELGTYEEILDSLALRFVIALAKSDLAEGHPETVFSPFALFAYDEVTGGISGFPETVVQGILDHLPPDRAGAIAALEQTLPLLSSLQWDFYDRNQAAFRADLSAWLSALDARGLTALAVDLASGAAHLAGTGAAETIRLPHSHFLSAADSDVMVVDAGQGNDLIQHDPVTDDALGEDVTTLLYAQGDGDDTVDAAGADHILHRIVLTDIASADAVIRMGADGFSPVITFRGGGSITFTGVTRADFALQVWFSDGVVADQFEIISGAGGLTNETIFGGIGDDQMDGGGGSDRLEGQGGDDTYHHFIGSGRDTVVELAFGGTDTLWLHDFDRSLMRVANVAGDAVLTFTGYSSEKVTLKGQFALGFFATEFANVVETIRFSDGSTLDARGLVELLYQGQMTNGNTAITGTSVAETFHIGRGFDTVTGGGGADVYIRDAGQTGADTVAGGGAEVVLAGLVQADVRLTKVGSSLLLNVPGTADLTIEDQFGTLGFGTVQRVTFGDGSYLTSDRIAALFTPVTAATILGLGTNDTLDGTSGADGFNGRGGDDLMRGGLGGDTYRWARNGGSDTITDLGNGSWVETDRLILTGVARSDLGIERLQNDDLRLTDLVTGKTLTVTQHFFGNSALEEIRLDGGVTLTLAEINAAAVRSGSAADDTLNGTSGAEALDGLAGQDQIDAGQGNDTLTGGLGNDTLAGREGTDTYVVAGLGQGQDLLIDATPTGVPDGDTLLLTGVTLADLQFRLMTETLGDDLLILIGAGGDSVQVKDMFSPNLFGEDFRGIWRLVLDDGTVLGRDDLRALAEIKGTSGADFIEGTTSDDVIRLDAGNDTVTGGGGGDDDFHWGAGDGDDLILVQGPASDAGLGRLHLEGLLPGDVALARMPNDDLRITNLATSEVLTLSGQFKVTFAGVVSGVSTLVFADGSTMDREALALALPLAGDGAANFIGGGFANDVLQGGAGADTLDGSMGSDLYLWSKGDGNDQIFDGSFVAGDIDIIALQDVLPGEASFARDPLDPYSLLVTIQATGEVLQIVSAFTTNPAVKMLRYADGSLLDLLELSDLPILGTSGADSMTGNELGTVFLAGTGNDTLDGGLGDDTYVWRPGDGSDRIYEAVNLDGGDVLRMEGVRLADAKFVRTAFDRLVVSVKGQPGSVAIYHALSEAGAGIERFVFDDGVLSFAEVRDRLALVTVSGGGGGNDTLIGSIGNELFLSDGGDDLIQSLGGRDRIVVGPGTGADRLEGFIGGAFGTVIEVQGGLVPDFATLLGLAAQVGADVLLTLAPGVSLTLAETQLSDLDPANFGFIPLPIDADGLLTGTLLADSILGGIGNDTFNGRAGGDTLVGDTGNDTFELRDGDGGDTIDGGAGIDGVVYYGAGNVTANLATGSLSVAGVVSQLTAVEMVATGGGADRFVGDALENAATLGEGADTAQGGSGADYLYGGGGNDNLQGQDDGDLLYGDTGDDLLNGGAGNDFLIGAVGADRLIGAAGNDLLNGNEGNDQLEGGGGNDILAGGEGADVLTGGSGADVFRFDWTTEGGDEVADFTTGLDRVELAANGFEALVPGLLQAAAFQSGTSDLALSLDVRVYFETDTGILRYDADGSGAGLAVVLATLTFGGIIGQTDILVT